jgi:ubiquinone/menaquinone biosynthesis C-methylase UbiE
MMRRSTRENWENFWKVKGNADEVYSNSDRVLRNLSAVTNLKGKRVLEVGAGTGRDSFNLVAKGAEVFLLDYAEQSLKIIKELSSGYSDVHIVGGDAFTLPFPDNVFDVVFHQGLLEHFRRPAAERLLKENVRVLKKGGILLVDVPQRYHLYTIFKHGLIALNAWFAGWEREFSVRELSRELSRHGMTVVHTYGEWMYPSLLYRIVREMLLRVGVRLPLYPQLWKPLSALRGKIRGYLSKSKLVLCTAISIGVVGRK